MNETAENAVLKNILLDAAAREYAEELSSNEPVSTSIFFQRQMKNMISNPQKWARRKKCPAWKRYAQMAATFLITCSIAMGSIMVVSPTARSAIIEWAVELYENSFIYRFFGEPVNEDMPLYKIENLPAGYSSAGDVLELPNNTEITYENGNGQTFRFEYMRVEEGSAIVIDTTNMEVTETEINGCPGYLYMAKDQEQSSCITWYDEKCGIQFVIDGFFESDELVNMAENVFLDR